jgi:hypothetical protein
MSRFRLLLLGLLAVLAVGAVASASASAETCTGGSHLVFCNDNQEPLVGETVLGTSSLALLASHLGGSEAKFHCSSDDFSATLEKLGLGQGLILFLNCTELLPAGCELSANQKKEIDAVFIAQLESPTLATFTGNKGGVANEFATLEVKNCSVAGNYTVTGTQMVSLPEGGVSKKEHEIIATKAQSALKLGVESASFSSTTTNAHLGGTLHMANLNLAWLVMSGE